MSKIDLLPEEAHFIRNKILNYLADAAPKLQWEAPYAIKHQALPLYVGLIETLGIRPDGTLVRWSTEDDWTGVRELDEQPWINIVLLRAARFPELARLIPKRPTCAQTCTACQGTGKIGFLPATSAVICQCGGTGWMP